MSNYQIFSDSCCDLSTSERKTSGVDYFRMNIVVEGKEMPADLDWILYKPEEFYGWLSSGKKVKTTQVPIGEFIEKMRPVLAAGKDILYISCSSALSGSINTFPLAVEQLKEEFPDRKFVGVDSLMSSFILGWMVQDAAQKQKEGLSLEECVEWVEKHKFKYNQFCTVDTLKYLKDAGRVKGTAAFFGDIIGVKPIIISDRKGNNLVINKVRGTKASLDALFEGVKETIDKKECKQVRIGQGMCMDKALALKKRFEEELGVEAIIGWIGPIIGTSTGPGIIATFSYGKEVTRFEGDGK